MTKSPSKIPTSRPIKTLAQFIDRVELIVEFLDPTRDLSISFRGHSVESWPLIPKLYRAENDLISEQEDDLREEFQGLAWPYLSEDIWEPNSDWDWYLLMQHFGMPTRLLDWTESALNALYFALPPHNRQPDVNAAVWVLNPFELNRQIGTKKDEYLSPTEKKIQPHLPKITSTKPLPKHPIAIWPPYKSRRIAAQQGTFILHGKSRRPLEQYSKLKRHCIKIEIERRCADAIREQLRVAGTAETTVFPELWALSQEITDYYKYRHPSQRTRRTAKK